MSDHGQIHPEPDHLEEVPVSLALTSAWHWQIQFLVIEIRKKKVSWNKEKSLLYDSLKLMSQFLATIQDFPCTSRPKSSISSLWIFSAVPNFWLGLRPRQKFGTASKIHKDSIDSFWPGSARKIFHCYQKFPHSFSGSHKAGIFTFFKATDAFLHFSYGNSRVWI